MFQIENGVLQVGEKPAFAVGESYYPSFHHAKYPVPPDGDRIGEMKKDLAQMKQMGFNHVRFAAIGEITLNDRDEIEVHTPFVDTMIREADRLGLSVSVRLEGYVVNLHGYPDVLMIDNLGREQDVRVWYDFIQSTLHHQGLLEDNRAAADALARHYRAFPNVVAFQIYNEPHYPGNTFFDYHPLAVEAYRKWLAARGVMTEEAARDYQPPRSRKEQSAGMWALWRIFCRDSLTEFLGSCARAARAASGLPAYTCYTACQASMVNAYRGVDYFNSARDMDILGYTCYLTAEGADYYMMCILLDMNYSAAKLAGKETWCVELDSRTTIPPRIFNKNTYAVVGSGAKGILYYQWRGDYPSEATPIPNGCGLVNYDGSKTPNYDNAGRMVALLAHLSPRLVGSTPVSYGLGILHSDYAAFLCDAAENDNERRDEITRNSCMTNLYKIYTDIRAAGLSATFLTAEQLSKSGIHTLFVPKGDALSPEERMAVESFGRSGGTVYELKTRFNDFTAGYGYGPFGVPFSLYAPYMEFSDLADAEGWQPLARADMDCAALQVLEGDGYQMIVVTNTSCQQKPASPVITCRFPVRSAVWYTNYDLPVTLRPEGERIRLPHLRDGGILLLQ